MDSVSEFAALPCQIHSKIPNYGLLIFFFLIHKLHQFTQIIREMFGKAAQFLSKAITHITSKQNKKCVCGRFVSCQKDRGSFFPPYTMKVISYHRCHWDNMRSLPHVLFSLRKRRTNCREHIEAGSLSEVNCLVNYSS